MSYEFGNYNREKDYSLYQIGRAKKAVADVQAKQNQEKEIKETSFETKKAEANSLEALGAYGAAFSGMGKKTDVSGLGLSQNDQALVAKFVTPEQQARIAENILGFFA